MTGKRFPVWAVLALALLLNGSVQASQAPIGSDAFWVELEQKYGDKFPAVVVLDEAVSRYDDFNVEPSLKVHRIVAIFDPIAGAGYGQDKLTVYKGEKVEGLKVFVQRGGGKREEVEGTFLIEKPLTKGMRQVIITVPKLEKRTLVDVSYRIENHFSVIRYFGAGVPVLEAKFELALPGVFFKDWPGWENRAVIKRPSTLQTEIRAEGSVGVIAGGSMQQADQMDGIKVFSWKLNNIPAFSEDELSPPAKDRMPFVAFDVSRWRSWKDFAKGFRRDFEKRVVCEGEVKKKAQELTSSVPDSVDKARAVLEYVKNEIECGSFDVGYLTPREVTKTLKEKKGDCTDVNGLLVAMLRSVGIPAQPLLVKWRSKGLLDARIVQPTDIDWQLACVTLGGKTYLLDGGHRLCPFDLVPEELEGTAGLLIDSDKGQFVKLPVSGPESNKTTRTMELVLTEDGNLKGTCKERKTGLRAYNTRRFCKRSSDAGLKTYYENKFSRAVQGAMLHQYSFDNLDNHEVPLEFSAEFASEGYFLPGDSQIRICPGELVDASVRPALEKKDEFAEYRPELSHRWSSRDVVTVTVPDGYKVATMPAELMVENECFRYLSTCMQSSPDKILFLRELEIKLRKPELTFDQFKVFTDQFTRRDAECITLERE